MIVERLHNGAWEISDVVAGQYFSRVYYGYTKREAMAQFRRDVKEMLGKIIVERRSNPRRSRARYRHVRIAPPGAFDPRSLRTIDPGRLGGTKLIVGCPKGAYDLKRRRCRAGTRAQAELHEKRNPVEPFFMVAARDPSSGKVSGYWTGRNTITTEPLDAVHWHAPGPAETTAGRLARMFPAFDWVVVSRTLTEGD